MNKAKPPCLFLRLLQFHTHTIALILSSYVIVCDVVSSTYDILKRQDDISSNGFDEMQEIVFGIT